LDGLTILMDLTVFEDWRSRNSDEASEVMAEFKKVLREEGKNSAALRSRLQSFSARMRDELPTGVFQALYATVKNELEGTTA